jgi:hypothetical protein
MKFLKESKGYYDERGWLKLSPSQISTLLDKCPYKWYLKKNGFVELSLIDTTFPGRAVHFIQEISHQVKRTQNFLYNPESREFKLLVWKAWNRELLNGYRIKRSTEAKYREIVLEDYPKMKQEEDDPVNRLKETFIYKKICRFIERDLFQATLKYCQLYLREIFPLQKPAINEDGSIKKEQWCTLELPKLKVLLRMRYDLLEEGNILSDTKVLAPTSCPTKDPIKEWTYMNSQEQYMYYSLWHKQKHGIIPISRQYTIKKNVTPLYIKLPDIQYNNAHFEIIMEKIRAAKKMIESECFHGNNTSNLCSEDYCGFWLKCKYVHRR